MHGLSRAVVLHLLETTHNSNGSGDVKDDEGNSDDLIEDEGDVVRRDGQLSLHGTSKRRADDFDDKECNNGNESRNTILGDEGTRFNACRGKSLRP